MLSTKWIIFLGFAWLIGAMFSTVIEASFVGGIESTALGDMINGLPFVSVTTGGGTLMTSDPTITTHGFTGLFTQDIAEIPSFFRGFAVMISWDYSFLEGSTWLVMIRWFLMIISIGILIPLAMAFLNALRGIVPI